MNGYLRTFAIATTGALIATFLMGQIITDIPATSLSVNPYHVCKTWEVPADDEEFDAIDIAPANITWTSIRCIAVGETSVVLDFEINGSGVADSGSTDVTCLTSLTTASSLTGDTSYVTGDILGVDFGAVTGNVDLITACVFGTINLGG